MAPTRKSRSVNRRYINEVSPSKDGDSAKRSDNKKRKSSDMLGARWTFEELTHFYDAYRKYGKDWKKVAFAVRNRSPEMVEAIYTMNRAYLSLPHGTASSDGLIAMMTDHYSNLGGSDSGGESSDGVGPPGKTQKRARGRSQHTASKAPDYQFVSNTQILASDYGFLSSLKKKRSGGSQPCAVGKRTPRFPVSFSYESAYGEKFVSPSRQCLKLDANASDDEVAHEIAKALAEASQRGGSPHVSRTPSRRPERVKSSPFRHVQREHSLEEDDLEGSTESESSELSRTKSSMMGSLSSDILRKKARKSEGKKFEVDNNSENHLDDIKEGCSGTKEDKLHGAMRGNPDDTKISKHSQKKKSKKVLFRKDEAPAIDALLTLADLSLMIPPEDEDDSRVQFKDENDEHVDDLVSSEAHQLREKRRYSGVKKKGTRSEVASSKSSRPGKTSVKVSSVPEEDKDPHQSISKTSRRKQNMPTPKFCKTERQPDIQLSESTEVEERLVRCLENPRLRRWCTHEWFYSAIDYPWFARREFVEYLNHVGLSHVQRLTRVEWGVIRSSLGKPRRFSEQFLKEEKEKLNQYRDSVRKHDCELREGVREGLPTDLARPLSVGQHVIAIHPKTREIHDGIVLTVDNSRCRVQFDRHELGVGFVKDIDCMPLNTFENMPALLGRQTIPVDKYFENINEMKIHGRAQEMMNLSPGANVDNANGIAQFSPLANPASLLKQAKVAFANGNFQTAYSHTSTLAQIQAKEADVQALAELTRALDKKEAVVVELRRLNDDAFENQKDGDSSVKDSEPFKKHYAAVLIQLNEANEQVSSALYCLRLRNTYVPLAWPRPGTNSADPGEEFSLDHFSRHKACDPGSQVNEIIDSSRSKARAMVDVAMQAMSSLKGKDDTSENFEEAIDYVNDRIHSYGSSIPISPDLKLGNVSDIEAQIPADMISECVAALLMIQNCTERQVPPSDVAQILDSAVTSLQPRSSQNLPVYTEIQKCMGIIRNQIMARIPA